MRINNLAGLLILVMIFSFCFNLMGTGAENSANGIYMKVSGKVIQSETGKGISGVRIHIFDIIRGESYDGTTDRNGNFVIRMVPQGIYEISEVDIHLTCPGELIIDQIPETIKVNTGRNVIGSDIYMKKGAAISGRVFKPDGVIPVTHGNVVVFPRLKGKKLENKIDSNGYYKVVGLGRRGVEELNYSVTVEAPGYADLAKPVKIKNSEEIKDFNFVVGKGIVHIIGTVTSSVDNQPIKGARISVLSLKRPNSLEEISNGNAVTDDTGNYSILGFKYPTNVDIAVFSDEYEMAKVEKYLKFGVNTIDFTLTPKTKTLEHTKRKEQAQLKCCELEDLFEQMFYDISCEKRNSTDENGKPCVKNTDTLNCMAEKCTESLINIVCREDCPKDEEGKVPGGHTEKYNWTDRRGEFVICINSESTILWTERMFHELYHICDREAPPDKKEEDPCAEERAYAAMICAFDNFQVEELRRNYQRKCDEEQKNI